MHGYKYRMIDVRSWDKHIQNPDKRRGGDSADRLLIISDTGVADIYHLTDEKGENLWDFRRRMQVRLVALLDSLGAEGWEVVSAPNTPSPSAVYHA
jgi:hypothetical protein